MVNHFSRYHLYDIQPEQQSESANLHQTFEKFLDPDCSQNLINCSQSQGQSSKKTWQSNHNLLSYPANNQTNQSKSITSLVEVTNQIQIALKISSTVPSPEANPSKKFHENLSITFWVILLKTRQTNQTCIAPSILSTVPTPRPTPPKILWQSIHNFLSYPVNKQTNQIRIASKI